MTVSGGALRIPAATGDLYQGNNTAANLVLRDPPASGPWTATAKINFEGVGQYQQAGIIAYGRRRQLPQVRPDRPHHGGDEKFEFIHEANANAGQHGADSSGEHRRRTSRTTTGCSSGTTAPT